MSKPLWAQYMTEARRVERMAEDLRRTAVALRCPVEESGGVRCSADAAPEHVHRFDVTDLP